MSHRHFSLQLNSFFCETGTCPGVSLEALDLFMPRTRPLPCAESKMIDSPDVKDHLLQFSHRIGLNIEDMTVEKDYMPLTPEMIQFMQSSGKLSEENVSKLNKDPRMQRGFKTDFKVSVVNERGTESYTLAKTNQSEGTLRSIGVETALYVAEQNDKFLPIDEIESSLHPLLLQHMIQSFLKTESHSQLLLTTHYDPLLSAADDYLRKDSFWLMDKRADGCSELHSLISKNGVNKMRSLQRAYMNNKLGALPQIEKTKKNESAPATPSRVTRADLYSPIINYLLRVSAELLDPYLVSSPYLPHCGTNK